MTLAEIPHKGEGELVETISEVRMGPPTYFQNFNPELLLSKGNTWTNNGAETEGKAIRDCPKWGAIPHADTKPRLYC
jgi:hypothetical protein